MQQVDANLYVVFELLFFGPVALREREPVSERFTFLAGDSGGSVIFLRFKILSRVSAPSTFFFRASGWANGGMKPEHEWIGAELEVITSSDGVALVSTSPKIIRFCPSCDDSPRSA